MKSLLALIALFIFISCTALAQESNQASATQTIVPRLIRFSGQVKGATGGTSITFTLHRSQQDTAVLWTETQNVQLDATGKYAVLLGATKAEGIPIEMFLSGEAQWLAVRIEGQPEQPRVLLVSVPYSLKAAEAETLAGHPAAEFVTTDKLTAAVQAQFNTASQKANKLNGAIIDPATTFSDNNSTQVVSVIQNGTGQALIATAKSNTAITGTSNATTGSATGLLGQSASTSGIGIRGFASATTGGTVGLFGSAASVSGIAIAATESATTGTTTGLQATVSSLSGTAAIIQNTGRGKILSGRTGPDETEVFSVDGGGNLFAENLSAGTVAAFNESSHYQYYVGDTGVLAASDTLSGSNLFVGGGSGRSNSVLGTFGIQNIFVGNPAGYSNQDGYANTFVGSDAGYSNIHGFNDTYVGNYAGFFATGNDNTFIGSGAGENNSSGHNNIYINNEGCPQTCTESNTIRIGGDTGYGAQTAIYLAGVRGQTSSGGAAVYVASDGKLGTTTSSRRFKENIADMGDTSKLFQLRPVTFFYKPAYDDGSHQLQYGLIAEEVEKIYPELVAYDNDGQPYTVKYQYLAPMLLNALQKEHAVVTSQQQIMTSQQEIMREQQHQLDDLKARMSKLESLALSKSTR